MFGRRFFGAHETMVNSLKNAIESVAAFILTRRGLLIVAGVVAFAYSVIVLIYVQAIPDIGIHTAFGTSLNSDAKPIAGPTLEKGDVVLKVGGIPIQHWADLLNAPFRLRERIHELENAGLPSEVLAAEMRKLGIRSEV